jgi:peptide deformylase
VVMINPEIIEFSKEEAIDEEGCLSIPNVIWNVKRPVNIVVKYLDLYGKQKTKKLKWYNARIVQHEMDHLDGILFVDKILPKK